MIIAGRTSQSLAASLASETGRELAAVAYERFPDGEFVVGVPGLAADDVIIVGATTTPRAHLELLQLQDAAREAGVDRITTVLPYMGYARQDKPMAPGSASGTQSGYPISARAMAKAISTGTDRVIVVTPHEQSVLDFFSVPSRAVDGTTALAGGLPASLHDPLFVSPDAGARDIATSMRDAYGRGTIDHFEKTRQDAETVSIEPSDADPANRDVVLIDDIVATGGTASEAVRLLTEKHAARVIVTCVHAVLAERARTRLARAGVDRIIATDTIEVPETSVSVAPTIAEHLDE